MNALLLVLIIFELAHVVFTIDLLNVPESQARQLIFLRGVAIGAGIRNIDELLETVK